MRLTPDDPFPELGHPFTTVVSADGRWLAVSCTATGRGCNGRIAVYRTDDLALWDEIRLDQGVETLDFHPRLPVLAVGTEDGDEFERHGALHLYEPEIRRRVGMTVAGAGIVLVRWRDARRLEVTFAEPVIDFEDPGRDTHTRSTAAREDWLGVTAQDLAASLAWPRTPQEIDWTGVKGPEHTAPQRCLAGLAAEHGRAWTRRTGVAAVHVLRDGRVLAVLRTGTLLECWSPDGTLLWSVPEPDDSFHRIGCRLYVTPDEHTAWTTIQVGTSDNPTTLLCRHSLADGTRLAERKVDFPVSLASRTDGAWVARDSREIHPGARWPPYDSIVFTPSGRQLAALPLGESDSSYDFQVRRCPHLLLLRGYGEEGTRTEHLEKWVVRLTPAGVERLFPYQWDDSLGPYLRSGPAVYIDDEAGPGLVHTCTAHRATHLVRRAFPSGDVVWAHRFDAQVTGVDGHSGQVYAVTGAGGCELLTLRAADGRVVHRSPLTRHGHTYTPTSLNAGPNGELVIGTVEGRLLTMPSQAY